MAKNYTLLLRENEDGWLSDYNTKGVSDRHSVFPNIILGIKVGDIKRDFKNWDMYVLLENDTVAYLYNVPSRSIIRTLERLTKLNTTERIVDGHEFICPDKPMAYRSSKTDGILFETDERIIDTIYANPSSGRIKKKDVEVGTIIIKDGKEFIFFDTCKYSEIRLHEIGKPLTEAFVHHDGFIQDGFPLMVKDLELAERLRDLHSN